MNFSVNANQIERISSNIQEVRAALLKIDADLDRAAETLYIQDESFEVIVYRLRKYQGYLAAKSVDVGHFAEATSAIASRYRAAETVICTYPIINLVKSLLDQVSQIFKHKRKITAYEVSSIVFDDEGSYGGDQGSARKETEARKQELFDLIRRNNPDVDLSDEQLNNFLKKMNSEGCGYVALINTIFTAYEGREEDFEKTFGYPMYYKGDLNYDMLLADLYSTMDNRDANGNYDAYHDYNFWDHDGLSIFYDPWKDTSGYGSTAEERAYYLQEFMKEHGAAVDVNTDVKVTAYNFKSLSDGGKQVIVSFHDGELLNIDGTVKQYINGGHAMVVTGVTETGMLIVSSWGGKYMIDPKGTNANTSMTFSTVEYK